MTPDPPATPSQADDESDEYPQEKPRATADDAQEILRKNAGGPGSMRPVSEVTTTPPGGKPVPALEEAAEGTFKLLSSLVSRTVFFDYFVHVANHRYSGPRIEPKVRQLIQDSRRFYRFVLFADLALRIVTVTMLIGTIGFVIYKTVVL